MTKVILSTAIQRSSDCIIQGRMTAAALRKSVRISVHRDWPLDQKNESSALSRENLYNGYLKTSISAILSTRKEWLSDFSATADYSNVYCDYDTDDCRCP